MNAPSNTNFFQRLLAPKVQRNFLYTNQKSVVAQLKRRRTNIDRQKELLKIIQPTPELQLLINTPHVVFFRQIATPLHETLRVMSIADSLSLPLCILEYKSDTFVGAGNPYKLSLGKLPIYSHTDRHGNDHYQNKTILDFNTFTGKPLSDVYTLTGDSLINVHHDIFHAITENITTPVSIIDASQWFEQFSFKASHYYEAFLSLFVQHCILAEIFLVDDCDEKKLTEQVVIPAFKNIENTFGVQPLIINYLPPHEQTRTFWDCYPENVNELLVRKGYSI